jgi:F5/8 type C domain
MTRLMPGEGRCHRLHIRFPAPLTPVRMMRPNEPSTGIPNTRWTDYGSPNPTDWWSVNFGQVRPVSDIRIYFYNDNRGVKSPASYELQYLEANGQWQDIPNQNRQPATPVGNDLNRITFPTISTQSLRIIVTPQAGAWAGFSEFESWRPE